MSNSYLKRCLASFLLFIIENIILYHLKNAEYLTFTPVEYTQIRLAS